jgi:hypothetical protein
MDMKIPDLRKDDKLVEIIEVEFLMKSGNRFTAWIHSLSIKANFEGLTSFTRNWATFDWDGAKTLPFEVIPAEVEAILYTGNRAYCVYRRDEDGDWAFADVMKLPRDIRKITAQPTLFKKLADRLVTIEELQGS